jgi:hypothetical protein
MKIIKARNVCIPLLNLIIYFFLFFGIASCSKDDGPEKENILPTCEITSPDNGEEFDIGDIITISVEAEDADGTIDEVSFYIDDIGVGSASTDMVIMSPTSNSSPLSGLVISHVGGIFSFSQLIDKKTENMTRRILDKIFMI